MFDVMTKEEREMKKSKEAYKTEVKAFRNNAAQFYIMIERIAKNFTKENLDIASKMIENLNAIIDEDANELLAMNALQGD